MVPFDQPEAALVGYSIGCSRTPHTNSTLFAGSHHKMGQERSPHKLSRTLFSEPERVDTTIYTIALAADATATQARSQSWTLEYKTPIPVIPKPWPFQYVQMQKTLHCSKQLERYNDKYDDLAVGSGESARRITGFISFSYRQRSATAKYH